MKKILTLLCIMSLLTLFGCKEKETEEVLTNKETEIIDGKEENSNLNVEEFETVEITANSNGDKIIGEFLFCYFC